MQLANQIRKLRKEQKMSQEELAEKVFVTRQTISNWENEKNYPDIHSLLLLSSAFHVSLDELIKGDMETMEEIINEQSIKKFKFYEKVFSVLIGLIFVSAVPMFVWPRITFCIPFAIIALITFFWGLKVEKLKKENDIQTFKEIIAFSKGERLDQITKQREIGKRPYQKILMAIAGAVVAIVFCEVIKIIISFV